MTMMEVSTKQQVESQNTAKSTSQEVKVLFEGTKILWKSKISIDLYFILHNYIADAPTIEIIAFHPTLVVESNRIYVSVSQLCAKLDTELLQSRVEAKRESLTRQKKQFSLKDIEKEIQLDFMVDFLLSRLDAPKNLDGAFIILLVPHGSDQVDDSIPNLGITCEKPADLEPYRPNFKHKLSVAEKYEFHSKLHDVKEDTIIVHQTNGLVECALDTNGNAAAILLANLDMQKIAAERRARAWSILQHFAKCCRVIIARKMVEKFRIRLARMENPNYMAAPIRRSQFVVKATIQAQIENHKVFMAAATAAAAAATFANFNHHVRPILAPIDTDNCSVKSIETMPCSERRVSPNSVANTPKRTPTRRNSLIPDMNSSVKRNVSRRNSINVNASPSSASLGGINLRSQQSQKTGAVVGSSFRAAQQLRRSIKSAEMFPYNDSPYSSSKFTGSPLDQEPLKVEQTMTSFYERLKFL